MGQIGPKQPILKVKTLGHSTFLKIITTVSAYVKLLEPTPVTKWVKWTKLGQIWVKFEPNWPKRAQLDRSTYFDRKFYLYHSTKIAKAGPGFDEIP